MKMIKDKLTYPYQLLVKFIFILNKMWFSIKKNAGVISIIFACHWSVIITYNTKLLHRSDYKPRTNLSDVMAESFYSSAHPQTIIISYDEYNEIDFKVLKDFQSRNSVIVLNKKFSTKNTIIHMKKIDAVILFIKGYNNHTLTTTLQNFLKTPWKNPMPTFFIIDNSLDKCLFAVDILKTMWKFRIISYFLCINKHENVLIFTFNPFSNWAPFPWQIVRTIKYLYKNWTLLVQKYQKEYMIKYSLDFNRIEVLDGYPLIFGILGTNSSELESVHLTLIKKYRSKYRYMKAIMKTLNLRGRYYFFSQSHLIHTNKKELAKQLYQSDADIISGGVTATSSIHYLYDFERTFPTFYYQWGILTINRGYKTPIEKIQDFYGIWMLLFTIFILLVTFVVIYLFEQRRIHFALFEIIRLLVNAGLYTRMETLSLRMFFSIIFIYFLIIQATFNGNLTNFLTKPVLKKHPETLESLKSLGYNNIYGVYALNYSIMHDTNFTSSNQCWNRLNNETNAACIDNHIMLRIRALNETLYYVSQKPFGFFYRYFYIRTNWLLLDKVNQAIMRIWESGLKQCWENKYYSKKLLRIEIKKAKSVFVYASIKFNNLIFAFVMLGFGLFCATLAFITEFYLYR